MNRIFIDMDGVLADFDGMKRKMGVEGETLKRMQGAYLQLEPVPGALQAVRSLIGMGYECWVATKPPTGISWAYMDKAQWVLNHLPELKRRIVITHDKGLLGDENDYLIDDRPHKANCEKFRGSLIVFEGNPLLMWRGILETFRAECRTSDAGEKQP